MSMNAMDSEVRRTMKIALVSDDGTNVSKHFGRAQYVVFTLENGESQEMNREPNRAICTR